MMDCARSSERAYRWTRSSNVVLVWSIMASRGAGGSPAASKASSGTRLGLLARACRPRASASRLAGSMVTTQVWRPRRAPSMAMAADTVVLPTPPGPAQMTICPSRADSRLTTGSRLAHGVFDGVGEKVQLLAGEAFPEEEGQVDHRRRPVETVDQRLPVLLLYGPTVAVELAAGEQCLGALGGQGRGVPGPGPEPPGCLQPAERSVDRGILGKRRVEHVHVEAVDVHADSLLQQPGGLEGLLHRGLLGQGDEVDGHLVGIVQPVRHPPCMTGQRADGNRFEEPVRRPQHRHRMAGGRGVQDGKVELALAGHLVPDLAEHEDVPQAGSGMGDVVDEL